MNIKEQLYKLIEEKIANQKQLIYKEIATLKNSAENESKSTAGDKHETGRAMIHNEQEKLSFQLKEIENQETLLRKIDPKVFSEKIQLGSLVMTNKLNFYICISAGKYTINAVDYMAISAASPIALALSAKKVNDIVSLNNFEYLVQSVY